jgi:hypothetical protein
LTAAGSPEFLRDGADELLSASGEPDTGRYTQHPLDWSRHALAIIVEHGL